MNLSKACGVKAALVAQVDNNVSVVESDVFDFDPLILRSSDIRGLVSIQLNQDLYYRMGQALAEYLGAYQVRSVFVAQDARLSSPAFTTALIQGLSDAGVSVLDLGRVPTPVLYFACHEMNEHSGFMVTGSHNPAEYNGLKLVIQGRSVQHADLEAIFSLIHKPYLASLPAAVSSFDILPLYLARVQQSVKLHRPLKVVIDAGNGVAGPLAVELLSQLGCELISLYCEMDGHFLNHHPDPAVEANLSDLKHAVIAEQADIGLAFDGDGDRLGVVTNTAEVIWPDRLMMFFAKALLVEHPKAMFVFDVKCSSELPKLIESLGGRARMCPTGHSLVKAAMIEHGALFAGEMSGHLFFKDAWYGFDDALYSACRLLSILSQSDMTAEQQFEQLPCRFSTPELKILMNDADKHKFMAEFCHKARFEQAEYIRIDGLRIEYPDSWGLLRASNTTAALVARFEADDEAGLLHIQALFRAQILAVNPLLQLPF